MYSLGDNTTRLRNFVLKISGGSGKFCPYHTYGVNEKKSNHGLEKFLLEAGSDVITGVQAAQTIAAIVFTPETGGGSDALDVVAIGAENGAKDAIKSEIEKMAEEDGAAEVAESTAGSYGIDIDNLNWSKTVQNHLDRPYQDSKLLINEIIDSSAPVADVRGTGALSWTVTGTFNGSKGIHELIIDPKTNTVWHFVFKSVK